MEKERKKEGFLGMIELCPSICITLQTGAESIHDVNVHECSKRHRYCHLVGMYCLLRDRVPFFFCSVMLHWLVYVSKVMYVHACSILRHVLHPWLKTNSSSFSLQHPGWHYYNSTYHA